MDWQHNFLWNKSKLNAITAHKQDRESHLFPFWCAISIELLSRSALAFVHPALLADPSSGNNILYVFGYYTDKEPAKSVPIKTVLDRLTKIIEGFKNEEFKIVMNLMERRNRDLHSGGPAFDDYPTKVWLADYYRICNILIEFQKKKLEDWLPLADANLAKEMIKTDYKKIEKEVKDLISFHKKEFDKKPRKEQEELRKKAMESAFYSLKLIYQEKMTCPACGCSAIVSGEVAKASDPFVEGDEIVRQLSILPIDLQCYGCGLKLTGYHRLQAAELGGHFILYERSDVKDYYDYENIDFEPDYGND